MSSPPKLDIGKEVASGMTIHTNVSQEMIIVPADRVRLCLIRNGARMTARGAWLPPLGVFLTLLAIVLATDFRDALWLTKDQWREVFLVGTGVSLLWLVIASIRSVNAWRQSGSGDSVEDIVAELQAKSGRIVEAPKSTDPATQS